MRLVTMKSSTSQTTAKVVVCCVDLGLPRRNLNLDEASVCQLPFECL